MSPEREVAVREGRPRTGRLSLVAGLALALLALAAGAEPEAPKAGEKTAAPTAQETPLAVPGRFPETSSDRRMAAGSSRTPSPSRRRDEPPLPTRQSVRAQIESIDPSVWLSRYGLVERRELR